MKKNIVAVDFSLNSTGLCILKDNKYNYFSFVNVPENKLKKDKPIKLLTYHKELLNKKIINVITYERNKPNKNYIKDQSNKMSDSIMLSDLILSAILKFINKKYETYVAIEGYSYGSKGNSFIDMISFNSTLRIKLLTKLLNLNTDHIKIFSPSSIKKFAGKGNANKIDMYNFFIKEKIKNDNFLNWNKKKKFENPPKPIDDLIDAYYISKMLKEYLENPDFKNKMDL